jgi:dTDP-glucose pyrophosphorylase
MVNIILAAGQTDHQNMVQGLTNSKLLTIVNGKPIISWVIGSVLRGTQEPVVIVLNADDGELISFCHYHLGRNSRITIAVIRASLSILHTLSAGVDASSFTDGGVRVILGDTLLTEVRFDVEDCIWVSNYQYDSSAWCVVSADVDRDGIAYFNKVPGLSPEHHQALIGRYDFSNFECLSRSLDEALSEGKTEISDVLEIYGREIPMGMRLIPTDQWIDFGHLEGIAKARAHLMESRAFNRLSVHEVLPLITKTSINKKKLTQEVEWYKKIPGDLAVLTPRVFDVIEHQDSTMLKMEFYGYGTLAEKFLFFDLSSGFWGDVLSKLMRVIDIFRKSPVLSVESEVDLYGLYSEKTFTRFADLRRQGNGWTQLLDSEALHINGATYIGLPKLIHYINERCENLCKTASCCIVHGDLCFNNILYDISSGVIKLIDPRGEFGRGIPTIYGDPRYDVAKLRHSYCGNYDHIVEGDFELVTDADTYRLTVFKDKQDERDVLFDSLCQHHGYDVVEIRFIEALLFLSMIPLHSDSLSKQTAFFLNGLVKLNECYKKEQNDVMH